MKTLAIIQARMGSTRAPGKVMRDLDGNPVLYWVYLAAHDAVGGNVVIATSTLPQDDVIAKWCEEQHIDCFRGSETDVLDRFYQCAVEYQADIVLRLTGDCPFLDPMVMSDVILLRQRTGADYATNTDPPTYPDGLDVECFTFSALAETWKEATRPSDRDCVTRYIVRNRSRFKAVNLVCPIPGLQDERWVLDTEDDYRFCQEIAKRLNGAVFYQEILRILDKEPELRQINGKWKRNERFYESIAKENTQPRGFARSGKAFSRANETIPFGAQTFSKSYLQFPAGRAPLYASHGDGAYIYDIDGNDYVDLVGAVLPVVLGYRDPDVDQAIRDQLNRGISFSLATEAEAELSELLCRLIPCAEMVKLGKSGTDVTTAAIRLARAYTGKDDILVGGYHGWADWSMAKTDRHRGIPKYVRQLTARLHPGEIPERSDRWAAIIVEPNDDRRYLKALRDYCTKNGVVLIFDEIITGFRYDLGGAQKYFGVTPDLACFGKAMANGMPISALVGRRDIMKLCEPPNNIFYSGTFFGEALSIAAAIATIKKMEKEDVVHHLWSIGNSIALVVEKMIYVEGLDKHIKLSGQSPFKKLWFGDDRIRTLFMTEMIQQGVLIIASHNVSWAHRAPELARIIKAYSHTLGVLNEAIAHNELDARVGNSLVTAAPLRQTA